MAGFNMHHAEELNEEQQPELGSLEAQLRLREEIERQLEVEREAGRAMAQDKLDREKIMRHAAERTLRQEEETRQYRTASNQATKQAHKRRSYGMDALLLCAVTLGMGAFLGPIVHPAPVMPIHHMMPYSGPGLPASALMDGPLEWTNSTDFAGTNWDGSRMMVDREIPMSDGRTYVQGHANWNVGGEPIGTEQFSGSYDSATGKFDVAGTSVEQTNMGTPNHLCRGHYTGTMTADGQLINGYMEGAPGVSGVPGYFNAKLNP